MPFGPLPSRGGAPLARRDPVVVLQALVAWLSRSMGRFFQAAFGWAVVALFGPRPKPEKTILSAAVAAAALWPVLVLGVLFPRVATFALAFVPLSRSIDRGALRIVWAVLAAAVPVGIGLLLTRHAADRARDGFWKKIGEGFPATLGVAVAFLFVAVAAPLRKLVAFVRRRVASHVPVVVSVEAYGDLAGVVEDVFRRAGLGLARSAAPFAEEAPVRLLRAIGGPIFRRQLPARLVAFRGNGVDVVISPNGLALRGPEFVVTRVHGLLAEALTFSLALQTLDAEAQRLEKRLKAVLEGGRKGGTVRSADSLERIAQGLLAADIPEGDWQVLHRELLQAAYAREGRAPLLMESVSRPGPSFARMQGPGPGLSSAWPSSKRSRPRSPRT